ncbi:MAG: alpha-amylase family glycosyl hydrolase [Bacteroidota bacterium]
MVLDGEWLFQIDSAEVGESEAWFLPKYPKTHWVRVQIPNYWDRYHLEAYDGVGWFAKSVSVEDTTKAQVLLFHGVDDDAEVWVNGIPVGSHAGYSDAFYLDVSDAMRKGENLIVVRVNDAGGPGGIYKPVVLIPQSEVLDALKSPYADEQARPSADWVRDAVIYEVYLRSFSAEGTIRALENRIEELKRLGITIVWIMPIHPVGDINRKGSLGSPYAVQDYYAVNPEFGTLEDFRSLVQTVHRHGMKIVIDLVANHTAWDSKLMFEHPEWYTKDETGAYVSPNADWTDVADLNYDHHELRKYMIAMMEYWVRDVGIDGFRCDVAEMVPTDFWDVARSQLDKIKPVMMLSEGTIPEHHLKAFDLTYSWNTYDILAKILLSSTSASTIHEIIQNESLRFPKGSLRLRFNSNHDKNAWDAPTVEKFGREGAKLTATLMFTLPGIPLIYNGEEVGNPHRLDLFERNPIVWKDQGGFRRLYELLTRLRREHSMFRHGTYEPVENSNPQSVYSFARIDDGRIALCLFNWSSKTQAVHLTLGQFPAQSWKEYFTGEVLPGGKSPKINILPLSHQIFIGTGTTQ